MLELSSIPKELIHTTVEAVANQEVELVRRRVMTIDNLETLMKEIDPYPNRPDLDSPRAKARADFRRHGSGTCRPGNPEAATGVERVFDLLLQRRSADRAGRHGQARGPISQE